MFGTRFRRILCWIALAGSLLCVKPLLFSGQLPADHSDLSAQAYAGWTGVLRIWISGGWQPGYGNFVPWLNQCAEKFEKRHPGVYLQIESMSENTLSTFIQANPCPDAILFAPGMLESGEHLSELDPILQSALRPELIQSGIWQNHLRAIPVTMGGYIWAYNRAMISQVPLDWSETDNPEPVKKQQRYLLQIPADETHRCWSCGVSSLCAPRRVDTQGEDANPTREELDLGLPLQFSPSPVPVRETVLKTCRLPALLPDNFRQTDNAYTGFINGIYAVIPVTQREIRRLQVLSESGRAPDWDTDSGSAAFTDQLLMYAIPQSDRSDWSARAALSAEFLSHLLSEESQKSLTSIRALRVTPGEALYRNDPGMEELEKSVSGFISGVCVFDTSYRVRGLRDLDRLTSAAKTDSSG